MGAFRILVADDHPIFRLGLCSLLGAHTGWEVCGEAADGQDAVEKCMQLKPDLLILDICMPKLNGVDAARQILKDNPGQRILILTDVDSEKVVRDWLQAGIRGWVLKSDGTGDLTTAVEALQRHNCIFSLRVSDLLVGDRPSPDRARRNSDAEALSQEGAGVRAGQSLLKLGRVENVVHWPCQVGGAPPAAMCSIYQGRP